MGILRKKLLSGNTSLLKYVCKAINKIFGYRNIIIFKGQTDFDGNAAAVYECLKTSSKKEKWIMVWHMDEPERFRNLVSEDTKVIGNHTNPFLKLFYYSCAKFAFYEGPRPFGDFSMVREVIYLTHGCPLLKNTTGFINLGRHYTTGCIITSENLREMMSALWNFPPEKFIVCGLPRNDVIFNDPRKFKDISGIGDQKIILWMPTFRRSDMFKDGVQRVDSEADYLYGLPLIHTESDLETVNEAFKEKNAILVIKLHPRAEKFNVNDIHLSNIRFWTHELMSSLNVNIAAFFSDTSAMIADYSSAAFDYMLVDKPLGYIIDDMDEYSRGFAYDDPLKYMPGAHIRSMQDFLDFIRSVLDGEDTFCEERNRICRWGEQYIDGKNSRRFLEKVGIL